MGYILNTLQFIAAEADFYNLEENRGDSYIPFMGFSKYITAKKNFNLFYDQRDSVNIDKATNEKNKKNGIIMMVAGLVVLIASFFVI